MSNPSNILTPKIHTTYTYHNQPPLPQKSPKVQNSGIYFQQTKNNQYEKSNKLVKKRSYERGLGQSQQQKRLGGSCKIIPRQKMVPKSQSTNLIASKVQQITKNRKHTIKIRKSQLQSEMKLYQWRVSTHFPIMKVNTIGQMRQILSKKSDRNGLIEVQLYVPWQQDIKYVFGEIQCLNLMNSLYILQQSLVGFERLYNKFGVFQPNVNMIFVTNLMKCKLWVNADIWKNQPQTEKNKINHHQQLKQLPKQPYRKVEVFYQKVINIFVEYFTILFNNKLQQQQSRRNINLIQKLLYELGKKQDFIQALRFIQQFLTAYTLKVNNRFLDIIQINQNRSRIFTKMDNNNTYRSSFKVKTLPVIPIIQLSESKIDDRMVKKNSLGNGNDYSDIERILQTTNRSREYQEEETQQYGQYKGLLTQQKYVINNIDNIVTTNPQIYSNQNYHSTLLQKQRQQKQQQQPYHQQPHIRTLKNSTNNKITKQHPKYNQVTQSNCKTIIINNNNNSNKKNNNNNNNINNNNNNNINNNNNNNFNNNNQKQQHINKHYNRDNHSFKRQSQVSICSKQTIVQKKNRFSMHEDNLINSNQSKFEHVKGILPNFTNQDFIEAEDHDNNDDQHDAIQGQNINNYHENHQSNNNNEHQQQYPTKLSRYQLQAQQDQYEQRVRNQIQKNVRQRNGWLLNPMFLHQTDDCAKSFQDSQPSIKAKIRDRNLTKLNRIKSSIANSIVE